ncbi:MAG: FtsX-like permease family protein [Chloroflexota bacterium]
MSVLRHKIWYDLWQRKARTLLAIFSISAGVFAIGTIFGMVDQLLSTMDDSHRATNPSHVNVILRQFVDEETAHSVESIEGVKFVEPLNIITGRYRTSLEEPWTSATIVMRDDFEEQTYDQLSLVEGVWPEQNTIAIERLSHNVFDIDIGDELIFELDGSDRSFEVGGIIRHPFVPPPDFGGDTHIMVSQQVMARLGIPESSYNQLLIQFEPYSEEYARDRMIEVRDHLAKQNVGIFFTIYQEPEEHWGRPFLAGMTFVLQVLAVLSLLASVILVINTMTAVITQQTDQIGIIKAIGGTTNHITSVYLAGVAVYGLFSMLIALPLGMFMAYQLSKWLLNVFNIDYEVFQFSWRAVVFQILAALIAPLLAALWPVLRGASISVREALASYGIGGDFGSSRLDQAVEQISQRFLSSPYAIALGNMFRRKGRLILTQSVLIIAGAMFILVLTLSQSITNTLDNELARRAYDIRFVFASPFERSDVLTNLANRYGPISEVEAWLTVNGNVMKEGEQMEDAATLGGELFGIPVGSEMYEPNMVRGRWLDPEETGAVAVVSRKTAEFNDLDIGDKFTVDMGEIGEGDWTIVGIYQAIVTEPFATDPIYVPEPALVNLTKKVNRARHLLVTIDGATEEMAGTLKQALIEDFKGKNIEVTMFLTRTVFEERAYAIEQFSILTQLLFVLSIVMGIVGGVGLTGALSIGVVERTREIGVLRAIGADSFTVISMFVLEGVLQGLISWLIAVPLAFFASRPMSLALGRIVLESELDFSFSYSAVFAWLLLILIISSLASILPALSASRISVRESLAYG